jgi:hypothetical protein
MKPTLFSLTPGLLLAATITGWAQPFITTQPQNQTNIVGTTATFSVVTTNAPPIFYQWRFNAGQFNETNLTSQTNSSLVLTNVQTTNAGPYAVVLTNVDGAVTSTVATLTVLVKPSISRVQPTNLSVSLGANPGFTVFASGTPPLYYHLRFNQSDLPAKTNLTFFLTGTLVVTNVQLTNAGDYTVVITNLAGSATSQVATLMVDATFTKITSGAIVTNIDDFMNCSWVDFDNDGFLDLWASSQTIGHANYLYHNNRDGTFTRVPSASIPPSMNHQHSAVWGDFDNDGFVDLFVSGGQDISGSPGQFRNVLYRNNGDGTFQLITNGIFASEVGQFHGAAWVDYDRDGFLDLFVTHHGAVSGGVPDAKNRLYRNNGDGTFLKITNGIVVNDLGDYEGRAWADYDNDGWPDLFVPNEDGTNHLYHNEGNGTFTKVTNSIVAEVGPSWVAAWGDYDNDGLLDLFVVNGDLSEVIRNLHNFLYHNEGNGTFTKVTTGSIVEDLPPAGAINFSGCAWGDYDNDGFLDLFVSQGLGDGDYSNLLYRNNGNSNSWLTVKLVGTASNRSAIGAKVRVKAFYRGASRWQLREISGGDGEGGQQPLEAHFGLGDATNIDQVRIEWPSGIVQTLTNPAPKQILTVVEHQSSGTVPAPPSFTGASRSPDGTVNLSVTGDTNLLYLFEASTNLVNWNWLGVRSNATGVVGFTDAKATNYASRFYRVGVP